MRSCVCESPVFLIVPSFPESLYSSLMMSTFPSSENVSSAPAVPYSVLSRYSLVFSPSDISFNPSGRRDRIFLLSAWFVSTPLLSFRFSIAFSFGEPHSFLKKYPVVKSARWTLAWLWLFLFFVFPFRPPWSNLLLFPESSLRAKVTSSTYPLRVPHGFSNLYLSVYPLPCRFDYPDSDLLFFYWTAFLSPPLS